MFRIFVLCAVALISTVARGFSAATVLTYDFVAESSEGGVASGFFSYDLMQPDLSPAAGVGQYIGLFEVAVSGGDLDGGFQSVSDAEIYVNDAQGFVLYASGLAEATHFVQIASFFGMNFGEALPTQLDELMSPPIFDVVLLSNLLGLNGPVDQIISEGLVGEGSEGAISEQVFYEIRSLELRDPAPSPVPLPAGLPLLLSGLFGAVEIKRCAGKA